MKKNDVRTFLSVGSDGGNILSLLQTGGTSRLRTSLCTGLTVCLLLICGFLQVSAQTFPATGLPLAITDGGSSTCHLTPATTTKTVTVSGVPGNITTLSDITINMNLSHPYIGDIIVSITPPGGTPVKLISRLGTNTCGSTNDFNANNLLSFKGTNVSTINASQNPIAAGNYLPTAGTFGGAAGNMADLIGSPFNGVWTLTLVDGSLGDVGQLHLFSVEIAAGPACTNPTAYAVTGGGGICPGSTAPIGLADSETGMDYQLVLGGSTNIGTPVAGTGNALDFPPQSTAGTYTVVATNTVGGCTADMTGSAIITMGNTNISYVKPVAGGNGSGDSWANASDDLQAMIDASCDGAEIWVAAGTYKPAAYPTGCVGCSSTREYAFMLKNNVKVYGGFDGTETALSQRIPIAIGTTNQTILSGDIGTANDLSDNCYHVVISVNDDDDTRLDGFTITGGNANFVVPVPPPCVIEGADVSTSSGGGMANYNSSPVVKNCTFSGNQALHLGGGIYWEEFSPLTLDSCIFNANKTGNALSEVSAGGAAYFSTAASANLTFTHCDFTDNRANVRGGALAFPGVDSVLVQNCTFTRDSAGFAGAVYLHSEVDSMDVTFQNCVFDENAAVQIDQYQFGTGAGAIYAESQYNPITLNLDSCQFTGNKTDLTSLGSGGAIWARASNYEPADLALNLNNTVFSGNEAVFGGAVICGGAAVSVNLAVDSCTFENNVATGHDFSTGGAISFSAQVTEPPTKPAGEAKSLVLTQTLTLTNSLFEGNSAYNSAGAVSVGGDVEATMSGCDFLSNLAGLSNEEFGGGGALLLSNLAGSTLTGCNFNDNLSETVGGAIQVFGTTSLTVDSCNFARDTASLGGAVYFQSEFGAQDATFTHCLFDENVAIAAVVETPRPGEEAQGKSMVEVGKQGGAIHADAAANDIYISVDSCQFTGNSAGTDGFGGAIFGTTTLAEPGSSGGGDRPGYTGSVSGEKSSVPTVGFLTYLLAHSVFDGNEAGDGGAVILDTGDGNFNYDVDSCNFTNNTAHGYSGGGVTFYPDAPANDCSTCTATFDDCLFENNSSAFTGGGLYSSADPGFSLTVTNCVFASNTAAEYGGGFQDDGGTTSTFNNCLFYGNACSVTGTSDGGAAISTYSDLYVNNCTFFGNTSQSVGGAIASLYNNYDLFVNNSIFWGNTAPGGSEQIALGASTNEMVNYSVVQGTSIFPGTSNSNADPSFRDATVPKGADNLWATADDGLALNCGSTAVNSGSNAAVPVGVTQDLKHANRIQNTTVDRGAYETLVPIFYITGLTVGNISACNGQTTPCTTDDTYTADVTVTYSGPAFTTLALSGSDLIGTPPTVFNPGGASYTFIGVTMRADGQPIRLTATFLGFPQCPFTNASAGTAASCGTQVPCPLTFTGLDATYCDLDDPVTLTGSLAPDGYFIGPGITDLGNGTATFDPGAAGTGGTVRYLYGGANYGGGSWASVSTNGYHTLAVKTDGTLWAWGGNEYGQLGDGTNADRDIPVQIGTASNWASVSGGAYHSLARKTDGTIWGWGYNGHGEVGNGNTIDQNAPVQIGTATDWQSISAGAFNNHAIKTDGTLWSWGWGNGGALGTGNTANSSVPVQVGTATDWASVEAGNGNGFAIKTDGSLWVWGNNYYGGLGIGNTTNQLNPVQVGSATNWASVAAAFDHTLALRTDGTLWATGINDYGQLGTGNNSNTSSFVQAGTDTDWQSIGAQSEHSIAVKTDGTLWAWGYNGDGALGTGNNTDSNTPLQVGTGSDWASNVAAGFYHAVAMKTDGTLWAFGANDYGGLGNGTPGASNVPTGVVTIAGAPFTVTVSPCPEFTGLDAAYCASDAGVTLTGNYAPEGEFSGAGITDNGDGTAFFDPAAAGAGGDITYALASGTPWTSVSAGYYHALALKADGTLWGWGYGGYGVIGDGTFDDSNVPVQTIGTGWADASAGTYHSLGVKTDGTLWGWGTNDSGEIGDGGSTETPVQIGTATDWAQVEAGYYRSFAIKTDGTLWAFGYNGGVFGTGNSTDSDVPVQVGTATNWASVSTHSYANHVLATRTDGTLWAWGEGQYGRLGTGNNSNQSSPVQVGTATDWAKAAVGDYHSLAIKTDGTLWAWGYGGDGELGIGSSANSNVPVQVTGSWSSIAAGYDWSLATKTDGTLWGWGYNGYGQLGNGTYDDSDVPVQSGTATNWSAVSASSDEYFSFGLRSDGNLYAWGANGYGYLGDGTYDDSDVPVQVGDAISSVSTTQAVTVSPAPNGISLANISAADCQNTTCTTDDTYTADVTVTYASKPATGTLSLTGPNLIGIVMPVELASIGATSHTFTGVTMLADGDDVDLTAAFSNGCEYNDDEVATAPECGGGGGGNITVSGFDNPQCPYLLNEVYTPDGMYNGAPQWGLIYSLEFEGDVITFTAYIRWTGSEWEFYSDEPFDEQESTNSTGSITELPCTTGWTNGVCGTPSLSGGCGDLSGGGGGGGLPCDITDITADNFSSCNDNGTTDDTDDYFTADVTVTFAYAPATGTLILDYGGGDKPGSANKSMVGLAEVPVSGLQCTTTYTFEDVQLNADGELFGLTAAFSDATCGFGEGFWQAPASCSCVPTTAFTSCPGNQPVNTESGTCAATVSYNAVANGEPAPTYAYEFSGATGGSGSGTGTGSTFNLGTTNVTITATNDCGVAVCTLAVVVTDNIQPTVTCKPHTVALSASGTASITTANVFLSGSDNCGTVNLVSVSPNSFTCSNVGSGNTVTLLVNDGHGNVSQCTTSVTVQDLVLPTALCKNATVQLGANGQGSTTAAAVNNGSSDACGIASMTLSQTAFTCANYGANTVTLTVTDNNNNSKTCTATVTVQDLVAPTVNCVASISPVLNAQGEVTITPAMAFLNGADNCGVVNLVSVSPSYFNCNDDGPNPATLTVNDGHGNTKTCTTTVNIQDDFIVITSVTTVSENCGQTNGGITITATSLGGQLGYSINGGQSFNLTGVFAGLSAGTYNIMLLAYGTAGCTESYGTVTVGSIGSVQTWYKDLDNDGYSDGQSQQACTQPLGYKLAANLTAVSGDCNDNDPLQHPGQTWFKDTDNDGYSNGVVLIQCARPNGFKTAGELLAASIDCNDASAAIHPGATEICNSLDDDCDGLIDEGTTGGLTFVGNVSLTNQAAVNAFSSCYSVIQGNLLVQNSGVLNLANLANLVKVTGNVTIKNTSLLNMNGLHNLDTIGGNLLISNNSFGPKLQSLDGLEDLDWIGGTLKVYQNSLLTDCCAIHDLIGAEPNGVGGIISIYSNLTTCENVAAINADCGGSNIIVPPGSEGSEIGDWGLGIGKVSLQVFPNPVSTSQELTVRIARMSPFGKGEFKEGSLRVFDAMGRTVVLQKLSSGTTELQLETKDWKTGIYLVQTLLDGVALTQKLIVE